MAAGGSTPAGAYAPAPSCLHTSPPPQSCPPCVILFPGGHPTSPATPDPPPQASPSVLPTRGQDPKTLETECSKKPQGSVEPTESSISTHDRSFPKDLLWALKVLSTSQEGSSQRETRKRWPIWGQRDEIWGRQAAESGKSDERAGPGSALSPAWQAGRTGPGQNYRPWLTP